MINVATIQFQEGASGDIGLVTVRASKGQIALGVSVSSNGDLEVLIPMEKVQTLIEALRDAALSAQSQE